MRILAMIMALLITVSVYADECAEARATMDKGWGTLATERILNECNARSQQEEQNKCSAALSKIEEYIVAVYDHNIANIPMSTISSEIETVRDCRHASSCQIVNRNLTCQ